MAEPAGSKTSESPLTDAEARFRNVRFGLTIFLIVFGVLFAASMIGVVVIRLRAEQWSVPPLPRVLWLSTLILLASSGTIHWALRSVKSGDERSLRRGMVLTTLLGVLFLALQLWCWIYWFDITHEQWVDSKPWRLALSGFYLLTGLHALHVVGGVIPLLITTRRAFAGRYTFKDYGGIALCAMYWHFLDAVWVVLFITLKLTVG